MDEVEFAICEKCNQIFPIFQLIFGPDPFAEELRDDKTPVILCKTCHYESRMDT